MATMGFELQYGNPDIRYLPEASVSANTFLPGEMVYLNSGGVTVTSDDAVIFGIALKAATGTQYTLIPVSVINTSQTWTAQSSAAQTAANVGEDYEVIFTTTANAIDVGSTSNPAVCVIDLDPRDGAVTAAGGRLLVRFLPGVLQQAVGAGSSKLIT